MSRATEGYDPLECLPAERVAELLGVSKSQVYTLARKGHIPHQRAGGSVLFPRRALERWLDVEVGDEAVGTRGRVDSLAGARARRSHGGTRR